MKMMQWVPLPNKHDSDGYTALLDHPDGALHYACWVVCTQVASRCHPRGTLVRGTGEGHDSASLSRMTRIPAKCFDAAIPRLIAVGWLERISSDGKVLEQACQEGDRKVPDARQEGARKGREGKGREEKGKEGKEGCCAACSEPDEPASEPSPASATNSIDRGFDELKAVANAAGRKMAKERQTAVLAKFEAAASKPSPVVMTFPVYGDPKKRTWDLTPEKLGEFELAFPAMDVLAEFGRACLWLNNNPTKKKTARGMLAFLGRWLGRSQDQGGGTRPLPPEDTGGVSKGLDLGGP